MEFTDYYAVLGVPRDADAASLKAAYRKLARTLHPDVNKDPGAEARFKKVNEAYEVLKDPEKRAKYDRLGANWEQLERQEDYVRTHFRSGGRRPGGFSDFFETFFGEGGGLDLDDLLRGAGAGTQTFRFSTDDGGTFRAFSFDGAPDLGGVPDSRATAASRRHDDLEHEVEISLEEAASGTARLLRVGDRQVEVRIPAGVTAGSRVRVPGEGRAGAGGRRGDVYLRVRLGPHARFTPHGRDLTADLPVRDDQAVLGAQIPVRTLTGTVTVSVPPRTQAGRTLRLRGKGIPGLRGGRAGDLMLVVRITVPSAPDDEEVQVYERLARRRDGGTAHAATGGADTGAADACRDLPPTGAAAG